MSNWLKKNDVITMNGASMMIQCLDTESDSAVLFNMVTQETTSMSIKELRAKFASGNASKKSPQAARGILRDFAPSSSASAKTIFNLGVITLLKKLIASGKTASEAIKATLGKPVPLPTGESMPMCSARQAYRLLKHSENPKIAATPAYSLRGNRAPRYGKRMEEIVVQVIDDYYGREKSRFSLRSVRKIANQIARAEGILAEDGTVSMKYIKAVLVRSWNPDRDHNRLDKRHAKSIKAVAKDRIKPGSPLNRVEVDGVKVPMVLRGERDGEFIEHIWLLHAIDCETSMPLGWRLLFAAPTTEDTLSCIQMAIFPKAELLRSMGVKFSVDPYGAIMNLVMDNGQENSKERLANLTKVGINLQWTPINSGHKKPFIERANRSYKEALEILPGSTRHNGKDGTRTEQAKKDENLLSKKEFEHWTGRWFHEEWAHTPLERFICADYEITKDLGITPAERWENFEKTQSLPLCPSLDEWRRVRFLSSRGKMSAKTGIPCKSFQFKGQNLQKLILQYGPDCTVQFFYDPHDFRTIYVPDKESAEWVELVNAEVGPTTPAYSFTDAKKRRATKRASYKAPPSRAQFTKDIIERSTGIQTKRQKKDAERQAGFAHERELQATERAYENPIQEQSSVEPTFDTYVAEDAIEKLVKHKKTDRTAK